VFLYKYKHYVTLESGMVYKTISISLYQLKCSVGQLYPTKIYNATSVTF